jgi:hypothetical protein
VRRRPTPRRVSRRPIFKCGLEDVVAQTSVETAHFGRPTASRGARQIARNRLLGPSVVVIEYQLLGAVASSGGVLAQPQPTRGPNSRPPSRSTSGIRYGWFRRTSPSDIAQSMRHNLRSAEIAHGSTSSSATGRDRSLPCRPIRSWRGTERN